MIGWAMAIFSAISLSHASTDGFWFHPSISNSQRSEINSALKELLALDQDLRQKNRDLAPMLGLPETKEITGKQLSDWLHERIKYFVPNEFIAAAHTRQTVIPTFSKDAGTTPRSHTLWGLYSTANLDYYETVFGGGESFSNLGASIAVKTMIRGFVHKVNIDHPLVGEFEVRSARIGILKMGRPKTLISEELESPTSFLMTLGLLFHEARHSDGSGTSLGFGHMICPPGHDLEGMSTCDFNLNGPYSVAAEVFRTLRLACKKCQAKDTQALSLMMADSLDRVVKHLSPVRNLLEVIEKQKESRAAAKLESDNPEVLRDPNHDFARASVLRDAADLLFRGENASRWMTIEEPK